MAEKLMTVREAIEQLAQMDSDSVLMFNSNGDPIPITRITQESDVITISHDGLIEKAAVLW